MHPLFLLPAITIIALIAFAVWNVITTRRRHKHGPDVSGVGGRKDPLSGDS